MSSPTVLTWVPSESIEEARAANAREAAVHLATLRETCERVKERLRRLKERGQPVPDFPFDYDEIAARVQQLLQVGGGAGGLELAHEMMRKAKHPLADAIDRQYLTWEAKEEELSRESTRRAAAELIQSFHRYDVKRVVASGPPALQTEIDRELTAIAAGAPHADAAALAEQVRQTLASAVPAQILAALRAYRLTLEERALARRTAVVIERLAQEQRAAFLTEAEAQLGLAQSEIAILDDARRRGFGEEIEALRSEAARLGHERFSARFDELRRRISGERRRHAMVSLVQTVLARHGYEEIDAMETITPEQIRNRSRTLFFRDAEDGDRFVELAFGEQDLFSLEVVRADDAGDSSDAERDRGAQARLCGAVAQIKENAGEALELKALRQDAVGVPVRARGALRRHVARAAAAQRALEQR